MKHLSRDELIKILEDRQLASVQKINKLMIIIKSRKDLVTEYEKKCSEYNDLKEQDTKLTQQYEDKITLLQSEWNEKEIRYRRTLTLHQNRIRRLTNHIRDLKKEQSLIASNKTKRSERNETIQNARTDYLSGRIA